MMTYSTQMCGYCFDEHRGISENYGKVVCPRTKQEVQVDGKITLNAIFVHCTFSGAGIWRKDPA